MLLAGAGLAGGAALHHTAAWCVPCCRGACGGCARQPPEAASAQLWQECPTQSLHSSWQGNAGLVSGFHILCMLCAAPTCNAARMHANGTLQTAVGGHSALTCQHDARRQGISYGRAAEAVPHGFLLPLHCLPQCYHSWILYRVGRNHAPLKAPMKGLLQRRLVRRQGQRLAGHLRGGKGRQVCTMSGGHVSGRCPKGALPPHAVAASGKPAAN